MTKRIPLTDDQYSLLRLDKKKNEAIGMVLAGLVNDLARQVARDDELFWCAVSDLAAADHTRCKVDWINRCIFVEELGSE